MGKINRIPAFLRRDLSVAAPLARCRDALSDAGFPWRTVEGAFIYVHPHQYREAMGATRDLKPDNIVVSASIEHLVAEVLANAKIWAKVRDPLALMPQITTSLSAIGTDMSAQSNAASDERVGYMTVKRTFLQSTPV